MVEAAQGTRGKLMARASSIWVPCILPSVVWLLLGVPKLLLGLTQSLHKLYLKKFVGSVVGYLQPAPEEIKRFVGVVHLLIGVDDLSVLFTVGNAEKLSQTTF